MVCTYGVKTSIKTGACIATVFLFIAQSWAVSGNLVIAEAYSGGGDPSGSTWRNDYIVIFNLGFSNMDVAGWSVQCNFGNGNGPWQVTPLALNSKIIPSGGYFLVQELAGSVGSNLPAPDAVGSIGMAASFKLALVSTTNQLSGQLANGTGPGIVDFLGCGIANAAEGGARASGPSFTTSIQRVNGGCTDSDNNLNDFVLGTPIPRNSASSLHACAAPVVSGVVPFAVTTNEGAVVNFSLGISQGNALSFYWYKIAGGTTNLIQGATNDTFTISNVVKEIHEGSYQAVVSNQLGSVKSPIVSLTVLSTNLRIRSTASNAVVTWSTNTPGFSLQINTDLTSTSWANATNVPVTVTDEYQVAVPPSAGSAFFRLIRPAP
jgi:hypothetical protein